MRRPVGLILAAVLLGLIAIVGLLMEGLVLSVSIFAHRPLIPKIPAVEIAVYLMIGFHLFCLWTAINLVRMRRWARPAMVAIGFVVFVTSGMAGAGLFWARQFAALVPPGPYSADVQTGIICAVTISFLLALAGVWWMIYFCRARVRGIFESAALWRQTRGAGTGVAR